MTFFIPQKIEIMNCLDRILDEYIDWKLFDLADTNDMDTHLMK